MMAVTSLLHRGARTFQSKGSSMVTRDLVCPRLMSGLVCLCGLGVEHSQVAAEAGQVVLHVKPAGGLHPILGALSTTGVSETKD